MIFKLPKEDEKRLKELFRINETNITVSNFYIDLLNNYRFTISDLIDKNKNLNLENDKIFELILENMQILRDNNLDFMIKYWKINDFNKLNSKCFKNNLFNKNITINDTYSKEYSISNEKIRPYELFLYNDLEMSQSNPFIEITKIGYFTEEYDYISIKQKEITWMSTIPHEITTMDNSIKDAFGNVLVLGLGLGYYPYMCLKNKNVKTITIVEKDKKIIDFYNNNLSLLNNKKIKIIFQDAIEFLKTSKNCYDFCFADLWHDALDGSLLYVELKKIEKLHKKTIFKYWIENTIKSFIRRCAISLIYEQFNNIIVNYDHAESDSDKIIKQIYNNTKNISFTSYDEIEKFLLFDLERYIV